MTGEPAFFEIGVEDPERGRAFYGALFGWELTSTGGGHQIGTAGIPGGLHGGDKGAVPWLFFRVDDMDAALARLRELGGQRRGHARGRGGDRGVDRPLRTLQVVPGRSGLGVRPAPAAGVSSSSARRSQRGRLRIASV